MKYQNTIETLEREIKEPRIWRIGKLENSQLAFIKEDEQLTKERIKEYKKVIKILKTIK